MRLFGKTPEVRWPIQVEPLKDEITSSWLVRAALAYDETPTAFTQMVWGELPVWNRDLDSTLSLVALRTLGHRLQTDPASAVETSLQVFLPRLGAAKPAWTPGLLRAGIYHRIRRRHGQQYCPSCLSEDPSPYFRRRWRLAFVFVCERHCCLLRDACPECDAPVVAHRSRDLVLDRCHVCDHPLVCMSTPASGFQIAAQQMLCCAWEAGVAKLGATSMPFPEWFRGLRILYHMLHRHEIAAWVLGRGKANLVPREGRAAPVEIARLDERSVLLPATVWLTDSWPQRLVMTGRELELRATAILDPKRGAAPAWLLQVVRDNFPYMPRACRHNRRKPRSCRISIRDACLNLDVGRALSHRLDNIFQSKGPA